MLQIAMLILATGYIFVPPSDLNKIETIHFQFSSRCDRGRDVILLYKYSDKAKKEWWCFYDIYFFHIISAI